MDSLHVFRLENNEWLYKGEYNTETKNSSFGPLLCDDKVSYTFPNDNDELNMLETVE